MPQTEALYTVEFGDIATSGHYRNGGVAVLETNRIFGGDSGYYYLGDYEMKDGTLSGTVRVVKHNPSWTNAFGDASPAFTIVFSGKMNNGVIEGMMQRTDMQGLTLPLRLTWREALP